MTSGAAFEGRRQRVVDWLPAHDWFSRVDAGSLRADALAGFTNATLVIPQAIAFASIAGLPPQYGFYTAIVVPVVAAIFGSSWHMVSGPTTAISALVFLSLSDRFATGGEAFIAAAITLTLLVGLIQIGFRILRLGRFVTFVSHSVVVGFTAGAALLIGLSQIEHAIGVDLPHAGDFTAFWSALAGASTAANWAAVGLCVIALAVAVAVRRLNKALPNYLIALAIASGLALLLPAASGVAFVPPVATVIPPLTVPVSDVETIGALMPGAFAVALIGVLEAISVARALALKSGQHIDGDREIYGQGVSNTVGSFFSAYAGSGSFTRSALNQESGAVTPLSAIFAAIWLVLIMLIFAPLVVYVPIPAMAGLILLVAWRLIDFPRIREILTTSRSETIVLLATFFGGLAVNLEFAIYAGVIVSLLMYLRRTMAATLVPLAPDPRSRFRTFAPIDRRGVKECPQLLMTRLQGPLYFGATEHLQEVLHSIDAQRPHQKHLFIRIEASSGIDLAGVHMLAEEQKRRRALGGGLYVSCGYQPIRDEMKRLHLPRLLGRGHLFRRKEHFIAKVVPKLDQDICAHCEARVFLECPPVKT